MKSFAAFNDPAVEKKEFVREIFDDISPRYDLLNKILSFAVFNLWHRRLMKESRCSSGGSVIDYCSGTGEVLIRFYRRFKIARGVGIDISPKMLEIAKKKSARMGLSDILRFYCLPAESAGIYGEFDCATIAFALRNVSSVEDLFKEMTAAVKQGGTVSALELTMPRSKTLRTLHRFYLKNILPVIGGLITGNRKAYSYLAESIMNFPDSNVILEMMRKAGLKNVKALPLSGGIATLFVGEKN